MKPMIASLLLLTAGLMALVGCVPPPGQAAQEPIPEAGSPEAVALQETFLVMNPQRDAQGKIVPVDKSKDQWKAQLSPQEFHILREHGTERAWTGRYLENKTEGVYACAGCGLALFESKTKFDSGTGWPSFYAPITVDHVANYEDRSYGWHRVENRCARCDGHLGHVFPDGPPPTGQRFCMNGYALKFVATGDTELAEGAEVASSE